MVEPFVIKDCALIAISTGKHAQNLRELRDRLEAAIGELPPKHRAAFVLVDIEGLPLREAARDAGVTIAALKSDLHRARLFLRDRLAAYLEEGRNARKR